MYQVPLLKIGVYFLMIASLLSCTDDTVEVSNDEALIGEWMLNDPDNDCTLTLIFDANNTGIEIIGCEYPDGTFVSSAESFTWEINQDLLTIDFSGEKIKSSFSFSEEGHLFLPNMTDSPEMYFIKMD